MMARRSAEIVRMIWVSIPGRSSYWREILRGAVDRLRSIPGLAWAVLDEPPIATTRRRPPTAVVAVFQQFEASLLFGVYSAGRYTVWINGGLIGDFVTY